MGEMNLKKQFKRWLKRRVAYTLSVFVAFLISGTITQADDEILMLQKDLSIKIEQTKKDIRKLIFENDKEIKKLNNDFFENIRRANYYSKPVFASTQGFFNHLNYHSKTIKDTTETEFNETLRAIEKQLREEEQNNDSTIERRSRTETLATRKFNYNLEDNLKNKALDLLWKGNGTCANDKVDPDSVKLGANIKIPKPDLPIINPKIDIEIKTPDVHVRDLPEQPEFEFKVAKIPEIITPNIPNIIEPDTITEPDLKVPEIAKVEEPKITLPTKPQEKNITIADVKAPKQFIPKMIIPPKKPNVILPDIIIPKPIEGLKFFGYIYDRDIWWGGDRNKYVAMSQMSLTDGKIKAIGFKGAYFKGIEGEAGIQATSSTLNRRTPEGEKPTDGFHELKTRMFYGIRNSAFMQWSPNVEISWFADDTEREASGAGSGSYYNYTQLIYQETGNRSSQTLDSLGSTPEAREFTKMSEETYNEAKKYIAQTKIGKTDEGLNFHNNQGTIFLANNNARYIGSTLQDSDKLSIINNEGTINGMNLENRDGTDKSAKSQIIFYNTPDWSGDRRWIYANAKTGKINIYAPESIVMNYASNKSRQNQVGTVFINNGEINIYGANSSGIMPNASEVLNKRSGWWLNSPINLYGDGSRGVYIPKANISNIDSSHMITKVHIGYDGNPTKDFEWTDIETGEVKKVKLSSNLEEIEKDGTMIKTNFSPENVDNAVGIMYISPNTATMQVPDITIEKFAKNSIGIYAGGGKLDIKNGNITLKGGENNTGIYLKNGGMNYEGNITIAKSNLEKSGGTEDACSVSAIYIDGQTMDMKGNLDITNKDSAIIYVKNNGTFNFDGNINIDSFGKESIAIYADNNSSVNIKEGNKSNIVIKDGLVFFANDGGKINAKNQNITVKNGSTIAAAMGENSNVDLTNSKLSFDGDGLAIYSDGKGEIDLTNVILKLGGKASAFDLDLKSKTPIKLEGTKIQVKSNDVTVFNLKNVNDLKTSELEESVLMALGNQNKDLIDIENSCDKYKFAAVDGGTLKIGNLDKNNKENDDDKIKKESFFYYRRFLGQRLKATTEDGITISAVIPTEMAEKYYDNQVSGFEMNSSKSALTNDETQINITENSIVKADRIDTDKNADGAVGLYINFGKINNEGKILVENEKETAQNIAQNNSVGIYGVNGTEITNNGEIKVGGDNSIGIFGQSYRVYKNEIQKDEFGTIKKEDGTFDNKGQGTIFITNEEGKNITLDGKNGIGIYAVNNNMEEERKQIDEILEDIQQNPSLENYGKIVKLTDEGSKKVTILNKGNINIGDSSGNNMSVGMYGKDATIDNRGMINIGAGGVGIYAKGYSQLKNTGGMTFKKGSIAVLMDNTSWFAPTFNMDTPNPPGESWLIHDDKTYKDKPIGIAILKSELDEYSTIPALLKKQYTVNGVSFDGGTMFYGKDVNTTNVGKILVGDHGVGFFLDNGNTENILDAKNYGEIHIEGNHSVGIYAKNANVINGKSKYHKIPGILNGVDHPYYNNEDSEYVAGKIILKGEYNTGIYLEGDKYKVTHVKQDENNDNKNTEETVFSIGGKHNTGVFVADGATAEFRNNLAFTEDATENIGVFSKGANVINSKDINFESKNSKNNIYIYATDDTEKNRVSNLKLTGNLTIDGMEEAKDIRTIGIYLKHNANENNFATNIDGNIKVKNGAIGIYSENVNNLTDIKIGEISNDAIGIYAKGDLNIKGENLLNISKNSTGIILDNGNLNFDGSLGLTLDYTAGEKNPLGIYAKNSSIVGDNTISIKNNSSETDKQVGIYFTGEERSKHSNEANINITSGNILAMYSEKIDLTNNGNIISDKDDNIGVFIGSGKFSNVGEIKLGKGIGIYAKSAEITNSKSIETKETGAFLTDGTKFNNIGTIKGEEIAVTLNSNSDEKTTFINNGDIEGRVGVIVEKGKLINNGTIKANNVGIYIKGKENEIKAGTLDIATGKIGILGKDANIDTDIEIKNDKVIGIIAKGNSEIKSNINLTGKDSVGIYLNGITDIHNTNIKTAGNGSEENSIGILVGETGEQKFSNVKINAKDGVGLYIADNVAGQTGVKSITYSGEITTNKGTAVSIGKNHKFIAENMGFNVIGDNAKSALGIYLDEGSSLDIGNKGKVKFNIQNGSAIYNNGGTLNVGRNVDLNIQNGNFISTENGNLISDANIKLAGNNSYGLFGRYFGNLTQDKIIKNEENATLSSLNGAIGIAVVQAKNKENVSGNNINIENNGILEAKGKDSKAIFTDIASKVNNAGVIKVTDKAIGICFEGVAGRNSQLINNEIKLNGKQSIGIYATGEFDNINSQKIVGDTIDGQGLVLEKVKLNSSDNILNPGKIVLGDASLGLILKDSGDIKLQGGEIKVGGAVSKKREKTENAIGIVAHNTNLILDNTKIEAGTNGIGIFAKNDTSTNKKVVIDNTNNIHVGEKGTYIYSEGADIKVSGDIVADNQTGIAIKNGKLDLDGNIIAKNGGKGLYFTENALDVSNLEIKIISGESKENRSIGAFFKDITPEMNLNFSNIIQVGDNTVGVAIENLANVKNTYHDIILKDGDNQIGLFAKNSTLENTKDIDIQSGYNNIGIYAQDESNIKFTGKINVADSIGTKDDPLDKASIGVFVKNSNYENKDSNSTIKVGKHSIGILGKDMNDKTIVQNGEKLEVLEGGIGILSDGKLDLGIKEVNIDSNKTIGIFSDGSDVKLITDEVNVGDNASVAIYMNSSKGNVEFDGKMNVGESSIGILNGEKITTGNKDWQLGDSSIGIVSKDTAEIINNANMNLGKSSVGIYSNGTNSKVLNTGKIVVGETETNGDCNKVNEYINSVGISVSGKGSVVTNKGTLEIKHHHSLGGYVTNGAKFINDTNGNILIDKGGIGIYVKENGIAINKGKIEIGENLEPSCQLPIEEQRSIGMGACGGEAKIINDTGAEIRVKKGAGMILIGGAKLENKGKIILETDEAIGIIGGSPTAKDKANIEGTHKTSSIGKEKVEMGELCIDKYGNIKVGNEYVAMGGSLVSKATIKLDGANIDVASCQFREDIETPLFSAGAIKDSTVKLLPDFASEGNGRYYVVHNFIDALKKIDESTVKIIANPLFAAKTTVAKNTDSENPNPEKPNNANLNEYDLVIAKVPYKNITTGEQFDSLDNGLDNILEDTGSQIIKDGNKWLGEVYYEDDDEASLKVLDNSSEIRNKRFIEEFSKWRSEFRGDIYATIQDRMQNINRVYDDTFYKLSSQYNLTKDSNKFSVIRAEGNYKNKTLGIDKYDYDITGLLYMKENEGIDFHSKTGYTLGFTYSNFKFDDAPDNRANSKERVFSLHAGIHGEKLLNNNLDITGATRLDLGYNRHVAKRALNLHDGKDFNTKGNYNTYNVNFDNRLIKNLYRDFNSFVDIYGLVDIHYGKISSFTEKGDSSYTDDIKLHVKSNDYLSTQAGVGINTSHKIYIKNDIIVKAKADGKYVHELGNNYKRNKAKLENGREEYWNLIESKKYKHSANVTLGIGVEKAETYGVELEATKRYSNRTKGNEMSYGVRFNYTF